MKLIVACALLLPVLLASSAVAIEQHNDRTSAVATKQTNQLSSVQKSQVNFTLDNCHRFRDKIVCDLLFTNLANKEQNISLFADCSRIINNSQEFGGLTAQIGQSSTATLIPGVTTRGFITFSGATAYTTRAKTLEIAYNTTDSDGTVKFHNVEIE